jgi:uncharacterized PurR-regulated membrane protein YhhQ (DUF165 family)
MNNNVGAFIVASVVGLVAYGILSSRECNAACQQLFGAVLNESGKIATASLIAVVSAQALQPQPLRRYRRG